MYQIQVDEALQPGLVAMAEPGPLSQIVINLLLNASHAMSGTGKIWIRSRVHQARALIEVEDQGPGLNPEVLAHLFEPFFTTKPAGKGTGLGLVVSQHLAQAMGGKLHGENAASGSARFTLELQAP
jgi:C4-dicarboxylate-specific signal transduction histidine kinase